MIKSVDTFICHVPDIGGPLRDGMSDTCIKRWLEFPQANLMQLTPDAIGCSSTEFQRSRRIFADTYASTPEYIVADDDCLLPEGFNLNAALDIFKRSCFSLLSLMPENANISPWTPEGYSPEVTDDVMEHYATGGIRFCLKGHLTEWPPMKPNWPGYDAIHGQAIRDAGGKIGYFKSFKMIHLGESQSTIWGKVIA